MFLPSLINKIELSAKTGLHKLFSKANYVKLIDTSILEI